MAAPLTIMYKLEIVDDSKTATPPKISDDVLECAVSRFTPSELNGYNKAKKYLTYKDRLLFVDLDGAPENCNEFSARYFDEYTMCVYRIVVDSEKYIYKYKYLSAMSVVEITDPNDNSSSKFTPDEIVNNDYYGIAITYTNYIVHTDTIKTKNDTNGNYFGHFFGHDNCSYLLMVNTSKQITITKEENEKILVELCTTGNYCSYSPKELYNMIGKVLFTFGGNVINTDLGLTNENIYFGFYFDAFDMTVYQVTVETTGYGTLQKNIVKSKIYKKIIRQIEITNTVVDEETGVGTYDSFTIDGATDSLDYFITDVKDLTFKWKPGSHFETWVTINAVKNDCTLHFPSDVKWIREEDLEPFGIEAGRCRELSIKDGIIVSAPVGEEWLDFD